ncbi:MAG: hypothetical protein O7G88_07655, partial [bacterium]|nr:hypothetical protein [bacterium]
RNPALKTEIAWIKPPQTPSLTAFSRRHHHSGPHIPERQVNRGVQFFRDNGCKAVEDQQTYRYRHLIWGMSVKIQGEA